MALSDWRKREIALIISKGHDDTSKYIDKISNKIDTLYDDNKSALGAEVHKLNDLLTYLMACLPGTMNDLWHRAKELRTKTVSISPTAHRSRTFGFGSLTLDVEEEADYMINESSDGVNVSTRELTEEEKEIFFRGQSLSDKKLIVKNKDKEQDKPKIFFPGLEYDENGQLK